MLTTIVIQGCLAALSTGAATLDHDGTETTSYYMHDGHAVRLRLDGSRVAVLTAPGDSPIALPGLEYTALTPLVLSGWTMVSLPTTADADALARLAAGAPSQLHVSPVFLDSRGADVLVTPHVLVRFRANVTAATAHDVLHAAAATEVVQSDFAGLPNLFRVRVLSRNGFDVLHAANRLAAHPDVVFAEPDLIVTARRLDFIPDDESFFRCWGLHSVGQDIFQGVPLDPPLPPYVVTPDFDLDAPAAWEITTGDPAIISVVFDLGVQPDHPDLNTDGSLSRDFTTGVPGGVPGGGPAFECSNHGTPVAGVIAARINNEIGGVGVPPDTRVASALIFIPQPTSGECADDEITQFSWIVEGLAWAETIGARITNHSYTWAPPSAALEAKLAQTRDAGMIHFASAGNDGVPELRYPASAPGVFSVAALDPITADRADFSNYGPGLDACAPGVHVITTDRTGADGFQCCFADPAFDDYTPVTGTSIASPMAAGVAALVLSAKPSLTPDAVERLLRRSCIDMGPLGYDMFYGHGRIHAHRAVRWALCPADLNLDGFAEFADYLEFLNLYEAEDPSVDFNQDGFIDFGDCLEFLNLFDAGC